LEGEKSPFLFGGFMSIVLYKKGNKHIVDGVECEIVVIETVDEMNVLLKKDHVHNPSDLIEKPKAKSDEKHKGGSDK
jgi:hypothetical protein